MREKLLPRGRFRYEHGSYGGQQLDLKMQRRERIYICGNISKHNVSRLTTVAKRLDKILHRHNVTVGDVKVLRVLDEFYVRFHDDIFEYHSTVIAELLNNLRWGIHEYLTPEYVRAKVHPDNVSDEFARSCYSDLMNTVRNKPYMQRFTANALFKRGY